MEEALEVWKKGDTFLEIHQDDNPESPREWDNLGKMLCTHGRYTLGDENYNDRESLDERLEELDPVVKLPLWLLDHSGLTMQTGEFTEDAQHWDSGQVGWIVATKNDILDNFTGYDKGGKRKPMKTKITPQMVKDSHGILMSEVETYSKYLCGAVYGYITKKVDTCDKCNHTENIAVHSCWGYYDIKDIIDEVQKSMGAKELSYSDNIKILQQDGWVQQ
tara:strand:+ start:559 stop:1215 length:657 start_codon:yes stop_codon:yes gene_type:complete